MKRVLVLVEGQTEERFVKDTLAPHLWAQGVDLVPKIAVTKRVKSGPDFKGGITDYQKVENDLLRLLGDSGTIGVTSFIDYYRLPGDFPGMSTRPRGKPILRAKHVEEVWARKIDHRQFRPFLMVHEFEALLFSKPDEICRALYQPEKEADLKEIKNAFPTPEDINDNPETAPSKRIIKILIGYQKTVHGPSVAKRIGLDTLRSECPHFNEWLTWLEGLSKG